MDYLDFGYVVGSCPVNRTGQNEAASRLKCGVDKFGNSQYLCVPNFRKTTIVEYCYKGTVGLQMPGSCLVVNDEGIVDDVSCRSFTEGCTTTHFKSSDLYQYPACHQINKKEKCFFADPKCPKIDQGKTTRNSTIVASNATMNNSATTLGSSNTTEITETGQIPAGAIAAFTIALFTTLAILFFIYMIYFRKKKKKRNGKSSIAIPTTDEEKETVPFLSGSEDNPTDKENQPLTLREDPEPLKGDESGQEVISQKFRKRFEKYLIEDSLKVCPISQIIIVGEEGVGKTTLLYHLLRRPEEEIKKIQSTRSMDMYTNEHGFIYSHGELKNNTEKRKLLRTNFNTASAKTTEAREEENGIRKKETGPISQAPKEAREEENGIQKKETGPNIQEPKDDLSQDREEKTAKIDKKKDSSVQEKGKEDNIEMSRENDRRIFKDDEAHRPVNADEYRSESVDRQKRLSSESEKRQDLNYNEETNAEDVPFQQDDRLEEAYRDAVLISSKMMENVENDVVLTALDFAGQGTYYASHQTYLRNNSIFIIVVDMSKDPHKQSSLQRKDKSWEDITERRLCDRKDVLFYSWTPKDYIDFWLNSIRMLGGQTQHILLVGTHKKNKKFDFKEIKKENFPEERFQIILDFEDKEERESKIQLIREKICGIIKNEEKVPLPAKWIIYQQMFDNLKSSKVLPTLEMLDLIDKFDSTIPDIQVHDMLRFFHTCGKILFFDMEKTRNNIILDIQWFSDCFKYIVSDPYHVCSDHLDIYTSEEYKMDIYFQNGLLEKSLYSKLLNLGKDENCEKYEDIVKEYQVNLGMMIKIDDLRLGGIEKTCIEEGWYIPCVNKEIFAPEKEFHLDENSSDIICFRFEKYLPADLFGRLVIKCLASKHWEAFDNRLCLTGADLCYKEETRIYLFTSKRIITFQLIKYIGIKSEMFHLLENIKIEIESFIRDLQKFYGSELRFKVGLLCAKNKGYQGHATAIEQSKNDFSENHVIVAKQFFCMTCNDWFKETGRKYPFLREEYESKECSKSEETEELRTCHVYSVSVGYIRNTYFEKGSGRYNMGLLKTENTPVIINGVVQFAKLGMDLKGILKNKDMERKKTELEEMSRSMKSVILGFKEEVGYRGLRSDFFFSWTQELDESTMKKLRGLSSFD